jgi:hypothetical protein
MSNAPGPAGPSLLVPKGSLDSLNSLSSLSLEGQMLLARPSSAVIRQTSIDDLFNDINSFVNNRSSDAMMKSNSFMVDDHFINDIATPLDDGRKHGKREEGTHASDDSHKTSAEIWTNRTDNLDASAPKLTVAWPSPMKGVQNSPFKAANSDLAPDVGQQISSSSFQLQHPTSVPPAAGAQAPGSSAAKIPSAKSSDSNGINHSLLSMYDIESVVKYIEVILYSVPLKELHITVLGTLFHRGTEKCLADKATRKYLFQQSVESGINAGTLIRKGESPVDFIVGLDAKFVGMIPSYTYLEKIVMWVLKDEYQNLSSLKASQNADVSAQSSKTGNQEFVQVKPLQYAAKSKQMKNGLFIFPLNCAYDNGRQVSVPSGFLNEIPCENSCYAVLFHQCLQHFADLQIIQYSNNSTGVRFLDKARKAIQSPAALMDSQFEALPLTPASNSATSKEDVDFTPTPAETAAARLLQSPPTPPENRTQAREPPRPQVEPHSSNLSNALPWVPHGNFSVIHIPADGATVIQVPSLLKMAAVTDAMNVGVLQRLEKETRCEIRDITVPITGGDGRYREEYRLLIQGTDEGRQTCLEKLERIMNASVSTPTVAPAADETAYAAESDDEGIVTPYSAGLRLRANQLVEINAM